MSNNIQAGTIVKIHGLQSAWGRQLNGQRAVAIQLVAEGARWQVHVELESESDATKAIKLENLAPVPKLPLPTGPHRGNAAMSDMEAMIPKLCELLVYETDDYQPSDIMFCGYAAMAFSRMGEGNFGYFYATQMEQMGGVLALANICVQGQEPGTESVLFGLLEGNSMYVDVLMQTLYWTPVIVPDDAPDDSDYGFDVPPTSITPDQDSAPYARTMSEGPLLLIHEMTKYVFGDALWAAMKRSKFYHLLVQRLLRLTAREAKNTLDGRKLGRMARKILMSMVGVKGLERAASSTVGDFILEQCGQQLTAPDVVTTERVQQLINGQSAS